jgi:hypothetical protein
MIKLTYKVMKKTIYSLVAGRILLTGILLAVSSFTESGTGVFAQGIYSRNKAASEDSEAGTKGENSNNSDGSLFRAGSTENPTDRGLASKVSPLKDGWEILLIAGIGYGFCIARRKKGVNKAAFEKKITKNE